MPLYPWITKNFDNNSLENFLPVGTEQIIVNSEYLLS